MERHGFAATSVDQILQLAGSSKGAFFHHFDSKQALARALVERFVDADLAQLEAALDATAGETNPSRRVLAFVGHFERWAEEIVRDDSSCLYIAALSEADLLDDETRSALLRGVLGWRGSVAELLRAALGQDHRGVDPDDLADHLFATFEGGYLLCRTFRSAEPMRRQLRVYRQLVEALLP